MSKLYEKARRKYRAFGLSVISDFVLDDFLPGEEAAEIEIVRGKVPDEIREPLKKNDFFQLSKREFLLKIDGVAKFLVSEGKRIVIEPCPEADNLKLNSYIYGTCFEVLLIQRGMLALHGSAVVIDGKCIIISGVSGAGKSTLALALREMGYPFLTDDVAFLSLSDDDTIWVCPGFPVHKLRRDSVETIGINMQSISQIYLNNQDKCVMRVKYGYQKAPVQLFALLELRSETCNQVSMTRLDGMQKLSVLFNHTFRGSFLSLLSMEVANFRKHVSIAGKIYVYRVIRPKNTFTLEKQIKLILQELKELTNVK
ncbi:serine kinase of the HPr protein, regulates carbohydrate metabolism [Desulfosporosinus youngiae DSM 17734]|uniref:Serine kinase of the HPr protein, regulates carbohydrate metabolism n=2 Tax=Desulfosporosinus TaxID=79206 RepID=H5XUE6_9FIRM|nr:serine kinase of the HPr protein, regulates carbohydrate metabolism [Desulfosporosinus youngiae DSM 17734]